MRDKLAAGRGEARALATLMGACALMLVAQWPRLSRWGADAGGAMEVPGFEARMSGALFALLFIAPLVFYFVAFISHHLLRAMGVAITPLAARMALFWALLATTPLMLVQGALRGVFGTGVLLDALGALVALAFLSLWLRLARAAGRA